MQKLRVFFDVFWKSATDAVYYRDILKAKFTFSLKYLAFLLFLFSLVPTVQFARFAVGWLPKIPTLVEHAKNQIAQAYPEDLVITLHSGTLSTNAKEPVIIDIKGFLAGEDRDIDHLITIDTEAQAEDFPNYRTFILFTKHAVFYKDNNSYKFYPLSDVKEDVVLDRSMYNGFVGKILPYADWLPKFAVAAFVVSLFVLPILITWATLLGKLLYLLVVTVFVVFISRILRKGYSYKALYRLGMHGLTIPILVSSVVAYGNIDVPFLYTGLFLIWMGIVLSKLSIKKK